MVGTTDFYKHLKSMFLIEFALELISFIIFINIYYYFFVTNPSILMIKLVLSLIAPVVLILIFIRNSIVNFNKFIKLIPDEKVDEKIIILLMELIGYLNVRETAATKILNNIEKLDKNQLLSIRNRLMFKYMRYCYFTNNDKFIRTVKFIAETTQEKKYLNFVENNNWTENK